MGCAAGSAPVRARPPPSPAVPGPFSAGRAEAPVLEQGLYKKLRNAEPGGVGVVRLWEDVCVCARPHVSSLSRDRLCRFVKAVLARVAGAGRNWQRCGQGPCRSLCGEDLKETLRFPEGFAYEVLWPWSAFPLAGLGSPTWGRVSGGGISVRRALSPCQGLLFADKVLMLCRGCPDRSVASPSLSLAVTKPRAVLGAGVQAPILPVGPCPASPWEGSASPVFTALGVVSLGCSSRQHRYGSVGVALLAHHLTRASFPPGSGHCMFSV